MATGVGSRPKRILYAVQYAVVVTAIAFLGLTVISLPLGFGLVGVKIGLFLLGMLTMGYGTYLAWPSSPEELHDDSGTTPEDVPRFQRKIYSVPPAASYPLHPTKRYPNWVKVYLATVLILATSFVMETVFGVVA